jgi:hypothetical protein
VVTLWEAVRAVEPSRKVRAFVAMSFRTEEHAALVDYFEAMKRATKATGLPIDLIRIDLLEGDYEISQKIMDEIDKTELGRNQLEVGGEEAIVAASMRRIVHDNDAQQSLRAGRSDF